MMAPTDAMLATAKTVRALAVQPHAAGFCFVVPFIFSLMYVTQYLCR